MFKQRPKIPITIEITGSQGRISDKGKVVTHVYSVPREGEKMILYNYGERKVKVIRIRHEIRHDPINNEIIVEVQSL